MLDLIETAGRVDNLQKNVLDGVLDSLPVLTEFHPIGQQLVSIASEQLTDSLLAAGPHPFPNLAVVSLHKS